MKQISRFGKCFVRTPDFTTLRTKFGDADNISICNETFGPGVFTSKDLYVTYEEPKSKGVEFMKSPTKESYGTEARYKDDSGNWLSLAHPVK